MALHLGELVAIISADDSKFHKTLNRVHTSLSAVGKAGAFMALASTAVQFGVALAPAVGLLAALPAALIAVKVAGAALRLALEGVGDALGSAVAGDAKKFEENLKGLPPTARGVVRELGGAFFGLKDNVQSAFFAPMRGQARGLGALLRGPIQSGMSAVGAAMGRVGARILGVAREGASLRFLRGLFKGVAAGIDGAGKGVAPLIRGIRDIAGVFVGDFGKVGAGLGGLLAKVGHWLSAMAKGGQATGWVRDAVATLGQLGRIAGNLGALLGSVFSQAGTGAGDLLGSIERVTGQMAAWAASAEGQDKIGQVFGLLAQVAGDLAAILPGVAGVIGVIAGVITSLPAPVQGAVSQFLAWSVVLGVVSGKVGPLLVGLGKISGGVGKVGSAFRNPESGLRKFASRFGSAAASVARGAASMAASAGRAAASFVASAARMTVSAVATAARVVAGWVLMGVQSLLQAARMAAAWILAMGPVGWIIAAVVALVALIIANWDTVKKWTAAAFDWIWAKIKGVFEFIKNLFFNFTGPGLLIKHWDTIKKATGAAFDWVWNKIKAFGGFVKNLFFNFTPIGLLIKNFDKLKSGAISRVTGLVNWLKGLPGRVLRAVGNLGRLLVNAGKSVVTGLWNGISGMGGWLYGKIMGWVRSAVPGPVLKFLGIASPSKLFTRYGKNLAQGMALGMGKGRRLVSTAAGHLARSATVPTLGGSSTSSRGLGGAGAGGSGPVEVLVKLRGDGLLRSLREDIANKGRGDVQGYLGAGAR